MGKEIWIRANVKGCILAAGRINLEFSCVHHISTAETLHARPHELDALRELVCFTKGMLNSSQNALIQISDGWAPIGKLSTRFELRNGVSVRKIVNDFSRDGDIECVESREDAEKLCLLSQRFPCCRLSLAEIARANDFDIDRISTRALRSLNNAVEGRLEKRCFTVQDLNLDANTRTLILAGR